MDINRKGPKGMGRNVNVIFYIKHQGAKHVNNRVLYVLANCQNAVYKSVTKLTQYIYLCTEIIIDICIINRVSYRGIF